MHLLTPCPHFAEQAVGFTYPFNTVLIGSSRRAIGLYPCSTTPLSAAFHSMVMVGRNVVASTKSSHRRRPIDNLRQPPMPPFQPLRTHLPNTTTDTTNPYVLFFAPASSQCAPVADAVASLKHKLTWPRGKPVRVHPLAGLHSTLADARHAESLPGHEHTTPCVRGPHTQACDQRPCCSCRGGDFMPDTSETEDDADAPSAPRAGSTIPRRALMDAFAETQYARRERARSATTHAYAQALIYRVAWEGYIYDTQCNLGQNQWWWSEVLLSQRLRTEEAAEAARQANADLAAAHIAAIVSSRL